MSDAEANSSSPFSPRRPGLRWFQFGLRTLLVVVTLVAGVVFAFRVYVEPYRQQRRALEVVKELGGRAVTAEAGPWQRRLLGADLVNITLIDLANCHQIDEYLPYVASLPCLETLVVGGEEFTDAHLRRLRPPKLTGLVLDSTSVTNEALAAWQRKHPAAVYQSDRQIIAAVPHEDLWFGYADQYPDLQRSLDHDYFLEMRGMAARLSARRTLPPSLRRLRHLRDVVIKGNRATTDADLQWLNEVEKALSDSVEINLSLEGTQVTDEGLRHVASVWQIMGTRGSLHVAR